MKMSDAEFTRQLNAATKRCENRRKTEPLAKAVSWDHSLGAVIDLNNGCRVCVPLRLLPELKDAQPRQLQNVEIMGVGQAVQWPDLDQQFGVAELLEDIWNTPLMAKIERRGGKAKSMTEVTRVNDPKPRRTRPRKTSGAR
ncbi:MAG: DUF2442 domain-containing protein [Planctomycetia bacterium]|nr:DUF2442 domain-containing protein [Planctomycetia bacterium]